MKKYLITIVIYLVIAIVAITAVFFLLSYTRGKGQITVFSSKAAALLKEASSLKAQGKRAMVKDTLKQLLSAYPQSNEAPKALYALAGIYEDENDLIAAKQIYQKLLHDYPGAEDLQGIQDKIFSINIKMLFSPTTTFHSQMYMIAAGDSLQSIAKKFNTTVELLKKANNLGRDLIKPGMKLKVQDNSFSMIVDKSQNTLALISVEEVIKVYKVSTGKNNSTPIGTFKIVNKLINPPWYSAKGIIPSGSPENILGTRWLGINQPGYGIHGTDDPNTIGYQCTEGCVRMRNSEVEELYTIVPTDTEVKIID